RVTSTIGRCTQSYPSFSMRPVRKTSKVFCQLSCGHGLRARANQWQRFAPRRLPTFGKRGRNLERWRGDSVRLGPWAMKRNDSLERDATQQAGVCDCPCHTKRVVHPIPCCRPCPFCHRRIKRGVEREHLTTCKKV